MASNDGGNMQEYRNGAKRTNNPSGRLASHVEEEVREKLRYRYDLDLPPKLRFDQTGKADDLPGGLPELLQKATHGGSTEDQAETIADALHVRQQPWLECTSKRQKHEVEVTPVALAHA